MHKVNIHRICFHNRGKVAPCDPGDAYQSGDGDGAPALHHPLGGQVGQSGDHAEIVGVLTQRRRRPHGNVGARMD